MKKYLMIMMILVASTLLLMACGGENDESEASNTESTSDQTAADDSDIESESDNENQEASANFPEEVIHDADADPVELEDQMGLEIGETGYVITQSEDLPLAVTLNSVERTQDLGAETKDGDEFYLVGNFTFENLGDSSVEVKKPDAASGSDESVILDDELTQGDLLGVGTWYLDEKNNIDSDNPTNSISLEPGGEENHKIAISMRDGADEYIIFFGLYTSNNRDYQNKAAWTFQSDQVDEG
ncbi:hypothetical protein NP439_06790 [Oceanobacillus jeddahense]|uniref:DUF4352 domain-containing protein n=1 Tax=Oceanobacillus jeddahense TaxID=1462527 RepID=A0ABY5JX40_9BACI|nr:hypothetical protein [Oceanobacillus jeddahense]UUI04354.1 hypothetical protein NP439_06790 [Oceanobacillus jeddahense]